MNTNVRMTELNGCVAQSHRAHETTWRRGMTRPSCSCRPITRMAPESAVGGGVGTPPPSAEASVGGRGGTVMMQASFGRVNGR